MERGDMSVAWRPTSTASDIDVHHCHQANRAQPRPGVIFFRGTHNVRNNFGLIVNYIF